MNCHPCEHSDSKKESSLCAKITHPSPADFSAASYAEYGNVQNIKQSTLVA